MELTLIEKLTKDVKEAAKTINEQEARYLVDLYYQMQDYRIQASNQLRVLSKTDEEPHETLEFIAKNFKSVESQIKACLKVYVQSKPIGKWLLSICGIGEILAAGLMAHIDITKCETAGQIWRFAGLDPTSEWKKGEKRPWNAKLKTLCWKIGESFVKVSNRENDYYGKIYKERKELEIKANEAGEYAEQAKEILAKKKIGKTTDAYAAYSQGKLPPAHIQARAKRYAVKMFLSHLFQVWYEIERGKKPAEPYAIVILKHAHLVNPPNWK